MRICLFFLAFLALGLSSLSAKVRILSFHYNQADFIEMQYFSFKKFLKDDF